MTCLVCGKRTKRGALFCDALCQAAHAEQRRVRFVAPSTQLPGDLERQLQAVIDEQVAES